MIFLFLTMESQNQVIQFTLYNLYVIKQFSYEFFVMINLPFLKFCEVQQHCYSLQYIEINYCKSIDRRKVEVNAYLSHSYLHGAHLESHIASFWKMCRNG